MAVFFGGMHAAKEGRRVSRSLHEKGWVTIVRWAVSKRMSGKIWEVPSSMQILDTEQWLDWQVILRATSFQGTKQN